MNYKFFSVFALLVISMGFAFAAQGDCTSGTCDDSGLDTDNQKLGGYDEHGCVPTAGYTWNESEQKCVREWETGEARAQNEEQIQTRIKVQNGEHLGENGKMFSIEVRKNNRIRLEANGISAECGLEMKQEQVQSRTRLSAELSNGKNAEVKIMPDVAAEKALERLRLKVCVSENNCTIELKEVGKSDEDKQLAYEVQIERHSRILGIFQKKMQIRAEISAENGEVVGVDKPWWAFIATEPAEE